jgi:hypothetical protein
MHVDTAAGGLLQMTHTCYKALGLAGSVELVGLCLFKVNNESECEPCLRLFSAVFLMN